MIGKHELVRIGTYPDGDPIRRNVVTTPVACASLAEQHGMVRVSTTSGAGWDELRRFAADPDVRKWLLDNTKDHAHVEAVGGEDDGEKGASE